MLDRIKQIIKEEGLQASSFADKIQVSRGTISHILNGRNEPSKDTIEKILNNYPDISDTWFLRGEGPMYKRERVFMQPSLPASTIQPGLFDEKKAVEPSVVTDGREYSQKNEVNKPENKVVSVITQDVTYLNNPSKKIDKIMIFFSDRTFMTFIPEE
jgi:transcriptional regulator with XRE-family HTH domain